MHAVMRELPADAAAVAETGSSSSSSGGRDKIRAIIIGRREEE